MNLLQLIFFIRVALVNRMNRCVKADNGLF